MSAGKTAARIEEVQGQLAVLEGVNRILSASLEASSEEELGEVCLSIAQDLTDSRVGFIGEHEGDRVRSIAIRGSGWTANSAYGYPGGASAGGPPVYGLIGLVSLTAEPVLMNDDGHLASGLPQGHPTIACIAATPIRYSGEPIGVLAVGNRDGGYDRSHLDTLEMLAPAIGSAMYGLRAHTELRARGARQAFLLQLSDAMRSLADPDQIKSVAAKALAQHLGVSAAGYAEIKPDGDTFDPGVDYVAESVRTHSSPLHMSDYAPALAASLRNGEAVFQHDFASLTPTAPPGSDSIAPVMHGIAVVPLLKGERLVACLYAFDINPHEWSLEERALVGEVAERTWAAVERAKAEELRATAEAELRDSSDAAWMLTEANQLLLSAHDRDAVFVETLVDAARVLGIDGANLVMQEGMGWTSVYEYNGLSGNGKAIPMERAGLLRRTLESGEVFVCEDALNDDRLDAQEAQAHGIKSFLIAPLLRRGSAIGLMILFNKDRTRSFSRPQIAFAEHLGASISLALDNERAFRAEQEAHRLFAVLTQISTELSTVTQVDDALPTVLEMAADAIGANGAALSTPVDGGWSTRHAVGGGEALRGFYSEAESPARTKAMQTRCPCLISDAMNDPKADPQLARRGGYRSYAAYPLLFGDELLGTMGFVFPRPMPKLAPAVSDFLERVAFVVSAALDNLRLYEQRVKQAEYAEALNRINDLIHSTFDIGETMEQVLAEMAETLDAEAAGIHMNTGDGWEFRYSHGIPDEVMEMHVPETGVAPWAWMIDAMESMMPGRGGGLEKPTPIMPHAGVRAAMSIPLLVRGKVFGVLMAGRMQGHDEFTAEQVDFFQKAASTLALALDNARLYETEHRIAETLQDTLVELPSSVPGVDFSHSYESATQESGRVGGDFIDIFEVDSGTVAFVLGDVSGKGIDAAVTTSLIRNTLRIHAMDGLTPVEVIDRMNHVMRRFTDVESFATLWFGLLDIESGLLRYVSTGHPPALMIDSQANIEQLVCGNPIVGAFDECEFSERQCMLAKGDVLLLYSDGATEARSRSGEFLCLEGLIEITKSRLAEQAPRLRSRELMKAVMSFSGGLLRDDVAILVVERA